MLREESQIVIAGGGVIGLCAALRLRSEGRDVLLIDRNEPGSGTSSGNAGVLATYECVPLGTPSVLKSLPRLLFDPNSPLSISLSALPKLTPWLARFARASFESRARRSAITLAKLLSNSLQAYEPLLARADARSLLRPNGAMHAFRNSADLDAASWERQLRHELGMRQVLLDRRDMESLEPGFPGEYNRGILFPDAVHLTDPFDLMRRLARAFSEQGGKILSGDITKVQHTKHGVRLIGNEIEVRAGTAIIALGAWSAEFARQLGDRIPLETERGYHVEFPTESPVLSRSVCPVEYGFYLTPMAGRLRAAGTVELSSLRRPPNARRLQLIENATRRLFPNLGPAQSRWIGFRPSLPDSLPVIGRSPRAHNVIYAFGHGHLGVTLGGETARIVTKLIVGEREATELHTLSPARFS